MRPSAARRGARAMLPVPVSSGVEQVYWAEEVT